MQAALVVVEDLVVEGRARPLASLEARAQRHRLHRGDRHQGLGQAAVEPAVPLAERPEAGRKAADHHLEHAAHRVAGALGLVDLGDHRLRHRGVRTPDGAVLDAVERVPDDGGAVGQRGGADAHDVAADMDVGGVQQAADEGAGGDPRGGLAGAGPLEDAAQVVGDVLERAREVGMARARPPERPARLGCGRLGVGRHHVLPVLVVAVADHEAHRASERRAVPHAGEDLHRVALDLHAAAAPVTALPPPQVRVDRGAVHGDARGKPFDDDREGGAV